MIDVVKRFFNKAATRVNEASSPNTEHDIRVATCALFVEMARIDETFTEAEMNTILSILKERYSLSPEHADALIAEAIEIIETLWRIVYVDGKMDQYEHYLMNKLQNLLRLTHDQLIAAKLKILHAEK
jgi:uncharacterized tellurite resistance protein B-like protein